MTEIAGQVKVKPNIKEFKETSVVFDDGTEVDADVVILATGYKFGFKFVDPKVLNFVILCVRTYKFIGVHVMLICPATDHSIGSMPFRSSTCRTMRWSSTSTSFRRRRPEAHSPSSAASSR